LIRYDAVTVLLLSCLVCTLLGIKCCIVCSRRLAGLSSHLHRYSVTCYVNQHIVTCYCYLQLLEGYQVSEEGNYEVLLPQPATYQDWLQEFRDASQGARPGLELTGGLGTCSSMPCCCGTALWQDSRATQVEQELHHQLQPHAKQPGFCQGCLSGVTARPGAARCSCIRCKRWQPCMHTHTLLCAAGSVLQPATWLKANIACDSCLQHRHAAAT
jgi:hypothetical protein